MINPVTDVLVFYKEPTAGPRSWIVSYYYNTDLESASSLIYGLYRSAERSIYYNTNAEFEIMRYK